MPIMGEEFLKASKTRATISAGTFAIIAAIAVTVLLAGANPSTFDLNSPNFPPAPNYDAGKEIKSWTDQSYLVEDGVRFLRSRSPAETSYIRSQIDRDRAFWAFWPSRREWLGSLLLLEICLLLACCFLFCVFQNRRRHD